MDVRVAHGQARYTSKTDPGRGLHGKQTQNQHGAHGQKKIPEQHDKIGSAFFQHSGKPVFRHHDADNDQGQRGNHGTGAADHGLDGCWELPPEHKHDHENQGGHSRRGHEGTQADFLSRKLSGLPGEEYGIERQHGHGVVQHGDIAEQGPAQRQSQKCAVGIGHKRGRGDLERFRHMQKCLYPVGQEGCQRIEGENQQRDEAEPGQFLMTDGLAGSGQHGEGENQIRAEACEVFPLFRTDQADSACCIADDHIKKNDQDLREHDVH